MPSSKKKLKSKLDVLREKIEAELDQTHKQWKGVKKMHKIARNQSKIPGAIRSSVNKTGFQFGCHTCLTNLKTDKNQPWIGDHIPPTNLKNTAKTYFDCRETTYLFPQCDVCASEQSDLVKRLNRESPNFGGLTEKEKKLIKGGRTTKFGVKSSGPKVSAGEGLAIQALGERYGCHSCGRKTPASVYHSDHIYPQEFMTSYMPQVFSLLKLPPIDTNNLQVRPQCPRCSHLQGGKLNAIVRLALVAARENGIVVYK